MSKNIVLLLSFFIISSGCLISTEEIIEILPLGPGGCIDETSCRNYCETNLQDCIEWCGENQHELCGAIAGDYLGGNTQDDIFQNTGNTTPAQSSYQCDTTPREREFETESYYEGPLLDSHVHMPSLFSIPAQMLETLPFNDLPVLDKDVSTDEIVCLMDQSNIKQAIGFYPVLESVRGLSVSPIKKVSEKFPNRIIAFVMPSPSSKPLFETGILDEYFTENQGVFRGYGELATYFDVFRGTNPNDSTFLETYRIAEKHNQIIMLHPTPGNLNDLEKAIKGNPNVTFLLHGGEVKGDIMPLIENNDNVYFDIDSGLSTDYLFNTGTKENFLNTLKENFQSDLEEDIALWKPRIEANPDKFVWGTDKIDTWHFDRDIDGLLVEYSRSFIGALDPSVQEKFAYRNAERMLES